MMISWWLPKFTHRLKVASRLATWKGMGGTSCCGFDCLRLLLHFRSENYGWELHKPWTWMCLGFECDEMESENAWEIHSSRPLSITMFIALNRWSLHLCLARWSIGLHSGERRGLQSLPGQNDFWHSQHLPFWWIFSHFFHFFSMCVLWTSMDHLVSLNP